MTVALALPFPALVSAHATLKPEALRVLPDPVIPDGGLLKYLSASRLKCWQGCRRQFYFRYVERIRVPTAPALFIGTQVHEILRIWNWARWKEEPLTSAELRSRFDESWQSGLMADPTIAWEEATSSDVAREQSWAMLETYFAESPIHPEEKPEGVEVEVQCELADCDGRGLPPLKGIIDLVRPPGVIVDYKTAARTPDPGLAALQHETQLCCYALLYREATGERETGFELHHLIKTKQPKIIVTPLGPMNAAQESGLYRLIDDYLEGIGREAWIPSPGQHCGWCDHFERCRAWTGGES